MKILFALFLWFLWAGLPAAMSLLGTPHRTYLQTDHLGGSLTTGAAGNRPRTVSYLISGLCGWPDNSFARLLDFPGGTAASPFHGEDVKLVFYPLLGLDFAEISAEIDADIAANSYQKVRIFAISMGDILARYYDARHSYAPDSCPYALELYEIDPCGHHLFIKPALRTPYRIFSTLLTTLDFFVLGWLALVPLPFCNYASFRLLDYQIHTALFPWNRRLVDKLQRETGVHYEDWTCPPLSSRTATRFVSISAADDLLDNDAIRRYFADRPDAPYVFNVRATSHGDTDSPLLAEDLARVVRTHRR